MIGTGRHPAAGVAALWPALSASSPCLLVRRWHGLLLSLLLMLRLLLSLLLLLLAAGRFLHGRHLHADLPAGLNQEVPRGGQDDLFPGADEVVVAGEDVGAQHVEVGKGLFDDLLHALDRRSG